MSKPTTTRGGCRLKRIPKEDIDFILANYGNMNYTQLAKHLGYVMPSGVPNKERVKSIIKVHATDKHKEEFERRFTTSGVRGKGARFKRPDTPPPLEVPVGRLWGNPQTDYYFFPARA